MCGFTCTADFCIQSLMMSPSMVSGRRIDHFREHLLLDRPELIEIPVDRTQSFHVMRSLDQVSNESVLLMVLVRFICVR